MEDNTDYINNNKKKIIELSNQYKALLQTFNDFDINNNNIIDESEISGKEDQYNDLVSNLSNQAQTILSTYETTLSSIDEVISEYDNLAIKKRNLIDTLDNLKLENLNYSYLSSNLNEIKKLNNSEKKKSLIFIIINTILIFSTTILFFYIIFK